MRHDFVSLEEYMAKEKADNTAEILFSIPSKDRYINLLDKVSSFAAEQMDFDKETVEQVNLAVIEAGTNAIRHGNKGDPEKVVQFRFCMDQDKLTVYVKDCGSGFDPERVQDPLSPENFMKPSGRGIFLMKALMDEVEYTVGKECGTVVRLVKYRGTGKKRD